MDSETLKTLRVMRSTMYRDVIEKVIFSGYVET
ncbi:hypothetical protein NIES267_33530 [Calothrix parasitica NIES-267]|uniref:Uncharacterized protein n=1 Tax=Calothrix parasitica NIES-267 TaxID=1973488 RepID=A0A1Z4LRJ6_9CYAN|nr:hypothetical protein NIES267_33530 [Calothrix parasitica NIES-267]